MARAILRHPVLLILSLPAVVVLLLSAWQFNPTCLDWKRDVNAATHLEMREHWGTNPNAASVQITGEGHWDDSWARMRRDVGVSVQERFESTRPAGCL